MARASAVVERRPRGHVAFRPQPLAGGRSGRQRDAIAGMSAYENRPPRRRHARAGVGLRRRAAVRFRVARGRDGRAAREAPLGALRGPHGGDLALPGGGARRLRRAHARPERPPRSRPRRSGCSPSISTTCRPEGSGPTPKDCGRSRRGSGPCCRRVPRGRVRGQASSWSGSVPWRASIRLWFIASRPLLRDEARAWLAASEVEVDLPCATRRA